MGSAFARALTSGIKGVAMVLDEEVQPLTSDSTKYGTQGIAGIQLLCFFNFNFNIFKRDFCAEEFWCLFEFFLSNRERLDLVFVTNAGVVGDDAWRALVCLKVRGTRQPTLFV